jgi:hypothetical protein
MQTQTDTDTPQAVVDEALAPAPAAQLVLHQAQQQSGGLLKSIEALAKNKDLTSEKMDQIERLFNLHAKMVEREAEQAFNMALAAAQAEVQPVAANRRNPHTDSTFADLAAIHAACKPIWTKHGLSVLTLTKPSPTPGHVCVYGTLRHSGGYAIQFENDWPLDTDGARGNANKTPIQGMGSATQYARRYTECMLFDLAIDRDNDGNGAVPPATKQEPELASAAVDWITTLDEATSAADLAAKYKLAFDALDGDGYARNRLIKARDGIKKAMGWK